MNREITSVEPIEGMPGVFHITYRDELRERLTLGPMPVDELMAHLTRVYYDQNGIGHDFVTPPEFFPRLGACYARLAIRVYEQLDQPVTFTVYEAGGGNGTLARSFLQEAQKHPDFFDAVQYHLIEQSEGLLRWQQSHIGSRKLAQKVTWHHADVTSFEFPSIDAGMYIAIENDDDLPSKAVVKRDGNVREIYLALDDGESIEVEMDGSSQLQEFVSQYPEWWEMVPEGLRIPLPVHIESAKLRERFVRQVARGIMVTTDYGYQLEKSAEFMPDWVFPLYKAFSRNKKLVFQGSPFTSIFSRAGNTNYTANVDFTLLSLPGKRGGYDTLHMGHRGLMDQFGMRGFVENTMKHMHRHGDRQTLMTYTKKLAHVVDVTGNDWDTLLQWKGFDLTLSEPPEDPTKWFYELAEKYTLGDVRPEYRKGPAR